MPMENDATPATRADLENMKAEILAALSLLLRDPVRLSILTAPVDDEPYTATQQQQDTEALAAVERGEYTTHEDILAEFGL